VKMLYKHLSMKELWPIPPPEIRQKIRDSMRGPLESLIAQARQEQIRKALPPSLFAKADRTLHIAGGVPVAQLRHQTSASRQLLPGKAFVTDLKLPSFLGSAGSHYNRYPIG
jgi:hypothetical protein